MRAWRVNADFSCALVELPERPPPHGGVVVRMQAAPLEQALDAAANMRGLDLIVLTMGRP